MDRKYRGLKLDRGPDTIGYRELNVDHGPKFYRTETRLWIEIEPVSKIRP